MQILRFSKPWISLIWILALTGCGDHASSHGLQQFQTPIPTVSPANSPIRSSQKGTQDNVAAPEPIASTDALKPKLTTAAEVQRQKAVNVKGVYVPGHILGTGKWEMLMQSLDNVHLNTVVLDIKSSSGLSMLESSDSFIQEQIGIYKSSKLQSALQQVREKGIYAIARIVTFKDPYLADKMPELAIKTKKGEIWRDSKGVAWADPFNKKVWSYNIQLAKDAALAGFDEIQFDYIRFPDNAQKVDGEVAYQNPDGLSKADAIAAFLKEAKRELQPYGVLLSADVFGMTTTLDNDMGIGQDWSKITKIVDFVSPMTYPSHYGKGVYGVSQPDFQPYVIVQRAMKDALSKNDHVERPAQIRPWLQDFTAKWVKPHQVYGKYQVEEQIKALDAAGINQFLLWNPGGSYSYK